MSRHAYTNIDDIERSMEAMASHKAGRDEKNSLMSSSSSSVKSKGGKNKRKLARAKSVLPVKDYESLDYDVCYNVPHKQWIESYSKYTYKHIALMRWIMVALIGIVTGTIAFLINVGIHYLRKLKYQEFFRVYDLTRDSGTVFLALLVIAGFNVFYSIFAGILVAIEPIAAGSGIPEIKCYLNGIRMPRVARIRTLIAKACGVLFSVAGGFLVGKEGPMIHSGAIVGAGIPQLRSFIWNKLRLPYPYFRDDKDKRDFVSCGAAAGVAAAFGAPIGGVLFSLEEGSSFW
ncbi:PREDICTED: chloride transport protein 6-like, partial [Amphimedon queenslandica]|uniref:Chloride channel protein n=2 Tax=Amphimedon queenslandica TaxID=400682 RepID=A0AAN0IIY9_AMPQE